MRFSELLGHLGEVTGESPRHLATDPAIHGGAALDQAGAGQLAFLEPGNALAAALAEAIVGPLSELAGRSLRDLNFRQRFGF